MATTDQHSPGTVHCSTYGARPARQHRDGRVTYMLPGGRWTPARPDIARTFALNGVRYWAEVRRAEEAAYCERPAERTFTVSEVQELMRRLGDSILEVLDADQDQCNAWARRGETLIDAMTSVPDSKDS